MHVISNNIFKYTGLQTALEGWERFEMQPSGKGGRGFALFLIARRNIKRTRGAVAPTGSRQTVKSSIYFILNLVLYPTNQPFQLPPRHKRIFK